ADTVLTSLLVIIGRLGRASPQSQQSFDRQGGSLRAVLKQPANPSAMIVPLQPGVIQAGGWEVLRRVVRGPKKSRRLRPLHFTSAAAICAGFPPWAAPQGGARPRARFS